MSVQCPVARCCLGFRPINQGAFPIQSCFKIGQHPLGCFNLFWEKVSRSNGFWLNHTRFHDLAKRCRSEWFVSNSSKGIGSPETQSFFAARVSWDPPIASDPLLRPLLLNSLLWSLSSLAISCWKSGFSIHCSITASLTTNESFIGMQTEYSGWGGGSTPLRSWIACLKLGNPCKSRCPFRARSKALLAIVEARKLDSNGVCQCCDCHLFSFCRILHHIFCYYSPTAECYGVSAQYRFRCVLGELGRFREKNGFRGTGSDGFRGLDRFQGSEVWKVPGLEVPGTGSNGSGNRFQWVPRSGLTLVFRGSRNRLAWFRDLGTGFREPKVLRRFQVPEIRFTRFRKLLCTLKVYFCTSKVYFCTLKGHFCTWKYTFVFRQYTVVLWKKTFVIWKCTFVIWKFTFALGM